MDVVEIMKYPEIILDLLARVMAIKEKYEVTSYPPFNLKAPHNGVEIKDESNVSHGEDVNEHIPMKE
ncbi:hypothetical protein KI387_036915, partial [Taxus chinensis]